ncbi:DNA replication/repair protein RecF [Pectinatus haikarae]|uniref:DNA replication and repair protein RecF n=1 Tax=Pectinatus haikarae TaxID=349096 RepID=A0ABT9Y653_9FIRM|nr:DNA replication/repair protein RecF [Pectinatus haikarae]MDQ0203316.1 DNA replication and repair protein RecF [Pectinatus haikarae]
MNINKLLLKNFRSYKTLELTFSPALNIFTGNNAQGKTNIIEAIYYAALGTSYRIKNDADLISWQKNEAVINIDFSRIDIENNIKIYLNKLKRRQIILNGGNIRQKNLPGNITIVMFSPEDLLLIKGSPSLRRRFLDIELSQTDIFYYDMLVKYNKITSQRNNLLKSIREKKQKASMLDIWDRQLIDTAVFIWKKRYAAINQLSNFAAVMQKNISDNREILTMNYKINNIEFAENNMENLKELYADTIKRNRLDDIRRGSTGAGPHHDDIEFFINKINLKNFGSQGQQRTTVLSLKLAELEYIKSITSQYPVLLLDDVMSELDKNRREKMLVFFKEKKIQTIVTATDISMFADLKDAHLYNVSLGDVRTAEC